MKHKANLRKVRMQMQKSGFLVESTYDCKYYSGDSNVTRVSAIKNSNKSVAMWSVWVKQPGKNYSEEVVFSHF